MKKINKIQIIAAISGVIATTALVSGIAYAADNSPAIQKFMPWHHSNQAMERKGGEKNEAGRAALEAGDYNAWLASLSEDSPIRAKVTEEDFNQMVEMHELMQAGKFEEANAIRKELGFDFGPGKGNRGMRADKIFGGNEAVLTAIENNDYNAWLAAMPEDCPMRANATEENFNKMVEMHKLMQAGDFDGAKEIRNELGFKGPGGKIKHQCQNQGK